MQLEKDSGVKQPPCWCTTATFEQALLDRIPAASRGLACLCFACATRLMPQNAI